MANSEPRVERFGMTPLEVNEDPRLTAGATRVYTFLATHSWDGAAAIGIDLIAKRCNMNRKTAMKAIRSLESVGHLRKSGFEPRMRGEYQLTSALFRSKIEPSVVEAMCHPRKTGT